MFAADVKIEKETVPPGAVYRGQRAVTLGLAVLSMAAVLWALAISIDQVRSYDLRAGPGEVKTSASNE